MLVTTRPQIAHKILHWFEANARELPWRNPPGQPLPLDDPDWPYRVWLSEIMLQQTVVATVKPYFGAFTARWPSVSALAAAEDADVMAAWAGLGYYARARNLLACARAVAPMGGCFPQDEGELLKLPGIGAYTAAAISAFAFGKRAVVVDGNIERITTRLFAIETPLPVARPVIRARVDEITPEERVGDFAQGLMDLAGAVCTPKNPKCMICPVMADCAGKDRVSEFPVKPAKAAKPERAGIAWWIEEDGQVLLVRRPAKGLLGGMRALPGGEWEPFPREGGGPEPQTEKSLGPRLRGGTSLGTITHIFTHFRLTLSIVAVDSKSSCASQLDGEWWPIDRLNEAGLPSVFAKAAARAVSGRG
jgi:A/G-specific adenine glycosylase